MTSNHSPKKITSVIFDLDGTLIDTEPSAVTAVNKVYSDWGITVDKTDAAIVTGVTWETAFEYLFRKYPPPLPIPNAKERFLQAYRDELERNLILVPGGVQAVRSLSSVLPLGLVSGSHRSEILWALRKMGIEENFQVILGAEDYPHSKPSPVGFEKALQLLQLRPENCLAFEDSTAGIKAARLAGLWVVAITSTNHFDQDQTRAHGLITDLSEVSPVWIQNLSFD